LSVKIPAPGSEVKVAIEAVWSRPDGTTYKEVRNGIVQDNWTNVYFTGGGYGYKEPGNWSQGSYTVDFFLDGNKFASRSFSVSNIDLSWLFDSIPPLTFESLNPKVNFVKFFEEGKGPRLPKSQRKYAKQFSKLGTRFMNWELDVIAAPGKEFNFKIDTVWYGPDGTVIWRQSVPTHINKDWKGVNQTGPGYGWEEAGKWKPGLYRVEFIVEKKIIASETFEISWYLWQN
jgi:hypothetical protein